MVFEDGQLHLQRRIPLPMGFLMARRAEGDQILGPQCGSGLRGVSESEL
jgi:hypothetical protein